MIRVGVVTSKRLSLVRGGFDFSSLNKKLADPEVRKALAGLRARHDNLIRTIEEGKKPFEPIDWDSFRARTRFSAVIDEFQKEFDALHIPEEYVYNPDTEESNRRVEEVMKKMKEMHVDSVARVEQFSKILQELEDSRTDRTTRMEDIVERYPEIAIEARDEIERGEYDKDQPL